MKAKTYGAIIPAMRKGTRSGGFRRYVEVANELIERGNTFYLFCDRENVADIPKEWKVKAQVVEYKELDTTEIDVLFASHPIGVVPQLFHDTEARQKVVWVIAGNNVGKEKMHPDLAEEYYRSYRSTQEYLWLVNHRSLTSVFPQAHLVEGGVNADFFSPTKVKVGYNGNKKAVVEKELQGIDHLTLVPLSGLEDIKLRSEYRKLDWFVSMESRQGWANMAAEALSCGVPVVSNGVNTEGLPVLTPPSIRSFFERPTAGLTYKDVVDNLLSVLTANKTFIDVPPAQFRRDPSVAKVLVACPTAYMKEYALKQYVDTVSNLSYGNYDVVLVDNSPDTEYAEKIRSLGMGVHHVERGASSREAICRSQNRIRDIFLNGDYKYLMFIEQDVFPPADIIERLMYHNKDGVGAVYMLGQGAGKFPCMYHESSTGDLVTYSNWKAMLNGDLQKIHGCGFGCSLFKRDVLTRISFRYIENDKNHPDRYFYLDYAKNNFEMFLDTSIVCNHDNRSWDTIPDR